MAMKATRTNIVIEDALIKQAMKLTGLDTKRDVVEEALRTVIALKRQERLKSYRGKLKWQGDLAELRGR